MIFDRLILPPLHLKILSVAMATQRIFQEQ
jgi:hypothetical protein